MLLLIDTLITMVTKQEQKYELSYLQLQLVANIHKLKRKSTVKQKKYKVKIGIK